MIYLLDTTTLSALMRRDAYTLQHLGALLPTDQVRICTITRGEILYGLRRLL